MGYSPPSAVDTSTLHQASVEEIEHHHYYNQVVLDVKRILKRFPPGFVYHYYSHYSISCWYKVDLYVLHFVFIFIYI